LTPVRTLLVCLSLALLIALPASAEPPLPAPFSGVVERVGDGDGLYLTDRTGQIRLWGVDAPELGRPGGQEAKAALAGLTLGKSVRVEPRHWHGARLVARIQLPDGRDAACEMARLGLARDWPKFSGGRYAGCEG
jgi:micrococcal nuclease